MTNGIFVWMLLSACVLALFRGETGMLSAQLLAAAQQAVETAFQLCGGFAFFCGILAVLREAGVMQKLARWLHKPLCILFGCINEESLECIAANLAANMLGMGNAATPMGIEAAKRMGRGDTASNALCMFLVINASSVQLLPTTVIALRAAAGSVSPGSITGPALLATLISTLAGIVACKIMEGKA